MPRLEDREMSMRYPDDRQRGERDFQSSVTDVPDGLHEISPAPCGDEGGLALSRREWRAVIVGGLTMTYGCVIGAMMHNYSRAIVCAGIVGVALLVVERRHRENSRRWVDAVALGGANGVLLALFGCTGSWGAVVLSIAFTLFVVGVFPRIFQWTIGTGFSGMFLLVAMSDVRQIESVGLTQFMSLVGCTAVGAVFALLLSREKVSHNDG